MKKYKLLGVINYSVGSCRDDRSIMIDQDLKSLKLKDAKKEAKTIIEKLHKEHYHLIDYCLVANLVHLVQRFHFNEDDLP